MSRILLPHSDTLVIASLIAGGILLGSSLSVSTIFVTPCIAASLNFGSPSIKPFTIAIIICGIAFPSSIMIVGIASNSAINSCIAPTISSGIALNKPSIIAVIICGSASINASIISGIASTIAMSSCIAPCISIGMPVTSALIIVVMIVGNAFTSATTIVGSASTIAISSCIAASSISGIFSISVFTIPITRLTISGSSVGSPSANPAANWVIICIAAVSICGSSCIIPCTNVVIICIAAVVIAGRFSVSPPTSDVMSLTPICTNSGSFSASKPTALLSVVPITSAILPISPLASCMPLEKSPSMLTPSAAKVSRNGSAIIAAAFFKPPSPAFNCCILSSNAPSAAKLSPLITAPIASASSPHALNASLPASIIVLKSLLLFPSSSVARLSLSTSSVTFPSASITSQYTSSLSLKVPSAFLTCTPSFSYAAAAAALPSAAFPICCFCFSIVLIRVFISPSMKLSAYWYFCTLSVASPVFAEIVSTSSAYCPPETVSAAKPVAADAAAVPRASTPFATAPPILDITLPSLLNLPSAVSASFPLSLTSSPKSSAALLHFSSSVAVFLSSPSVPTRAVFW